MVLGLTGIYSHCVYMFLIREPAFPFWESIRWAEPFPDWVQRATFSDGQSPDSYSCLVPELYGVAQVALEDEQLFHVRLKPFVP
jgi:hypothetical protein